MVQEASDLTSGEEYTTPPSPNLQDSANMAQFLVKQKLSSEHDTEICVTSCHELDVHENLPKFMKSVQENTIGLAAAYDQKCRVLRLALSSPTEALVVTLVAKHDRWNGMRKQAKHQACIEAKTSALQCLLNNPAIVKAALRMDKLAASIFLDHRMTIASAKDLLSAGDGPRHSLAALMSVLEGYVPIRKRTVIDMFIKDDSGANGVRETALQAWAAYYATTHPHMALRLEQMSSIDTSTIELHVMAPLAKLIRVADQVLSFKPSRVKHEIKHEQNLETGEILITSQRYKTKVSRTAANQNVEVTFEHGGKRTTSKTRTAEVHGRVAVLCAAEETKGSLVRVETVGRGGPSPAEIMKSDLLLRALHDPDFLISHPFVEALWFPRRKAKNVAKLKVKSEPLPPVDISYDGPLNDSQRAATEAILSRDQSKRVVLVHGPPGTGKTTVIAAAVTSVMASRDRNATVWLVAQSNVAVKNIAEKLASVDFFDFTILVSTGFHFDWHEHLYEKVERNVITSEDLPDDILQAEHMLPTSRVILCTLSMLSNRRLSPITSLVPLRTVIFDEASQIEIGDYLAMMLQFRSTLQKMVFIGDDKQLEPHLSQDIFGMESVFDKSHLRENALFLDTQYRMPLAIATCISENVYKGRLKSLDVNFDTSCCRFVDVASGTDNPQGSSRINKQEVAAILTLSKRFFHQKKSFRIITPYDAQRTLLENALKEAGLPWEDMCFNIDSFQGNEDDYILVSVVRTQRLGFLSDHRRVNVMLTRCKKGMVICTHRGFIEGPARPTLISKLVESLGDSAWVAEQELEAAQIFDKIHDT
ncbi:ATP-dependent helicase upf1 [Psilocybe cubensis]|uniref:ATP-dependent helicase upf1 n=2 Tax=Psilocybe cubensis TaxID=181762 RepID=A0ACB8H114_PSICU|nr:ATP-dependent helicase upf1 [Psilocybe cubensis]KAH9481598.1 ATP-dependent helicase upf1 [Psilocybe cubensis]